jgi:hypothetical protein
VTERPQAAMTRLLRRTVRADLAAETCPNWLLRPGRADCAGTWSAVCAVYTALTGLELQPMAPPRERRRLDVVLTYADGRCQIVEIDERQHFTGARALALAHYPPEVALGFDRDAWLARARALAGREPGRVRPSMPPALPGRRRPTPL